MGSSSSRLEFLSSWNDPLKLIDRSLMNEHALSQNLRWALHELMRLETCTSLIDNLLYSEGTSDSTQSISAKQHEERMKSTMRYVEAVLAIKRTKSSQSTSSATSSPSSKHASAPYWDEFQLAFTPSASRLFCAAAYSFVLATVNLEVEQESWMKSSMAAAGGALPTTSSTVTTAPSLSSTDFQAGAPDATAAALTSASALASSSSSSSSSASVSSSTAKAPDSSSSPSMPSKNLLEGSPYHPSAVSERIEIICKYVYIYSLIVALTHACERNIKLYQHMQLYNDVLRLWKDKEKSKGRNAWSELQISGYEVQHDRFHKVLDESLKIHDRWRLVLHYVYRDWELIFARHRLLDEIARWKILRANCAQKTQPSAAAGGSLVEENEVQRNERALSGLSGLSGPFSVSEVNENLQLLERQLSIIDSKMEGNERDSFSVGLAFLDVDLSGRIEVDETKDIPAWLFHLLDTKNRSAISCSDLRKVILECTKHYETTAVKICELKSQTEKFEQERTRVTTAAAATPLESTTAATSISRTSELSGITNSATQVLKNREELERLTAELDEQRMNLMTIYTIFNGAFKSNVFPQINIDSMPDDEKKIVECKQQLAYLVRNLYALAYLDPLYLMKSKLQTGDNHINNSLLNHCAEQMMRIAQKNESDLGKEERQLMHPSTLATASMHLPLPISFIPVMIEGSFPEEAEMLDQDKAESQGGQDKAGAKETQIPTFEAPSSASAE